MTASPTVQGRAFMVSAVTDESNESSSEAPLPLAAPSEVDTITPPPTQPSPRRSFFDEEYVGGRRVPSPPLHEHETGQLADENPTAASLGPTAISATAKDCLDLQERIHLLLQDQYVQDFKEHLIPSIVQAPEFHRRLHGLLMKRNRVEAGLENLLKDEAPDGTPLSPTRYSEPEYWRMSAFVERINRSMLTIYAEYLGANAALLLAGKRQHHRESGPRTLTTGCVRIGHAACVYPQPSL